MLARRIELTVWALVGLLNLGIWALVSLAAGGGVYPWWIWVVGPWGMVLLARCAAAPVLPADSPAGAFLRSGGCGRFGACR